MSQYRYRFETQRDFDTQNLSSDRAYYESETNIMIINEKEMFGQSIYALDEIYSEDPNSYVIPIAMEILKLSLLLIKK